MQLSWTSSQVRAAEEPLLAAGVPLMDRAAFALQTEPLVRLLDEASERALDVMLAALDR